MNMRADINTADFDPAENAPFDPPKPTRDRPRMRFLIRRMLHGGDIDDTRRLPRYLGLFMLAMLGIWGGVGAYLKLAPVRFSSEVALILPGAGAANSVNLADIGQASSNASSPYSSSAVSPTVTYQRLLSSGRVLTAAAKLIDQEPGAFGRPRVRLIDQTSLILFEMKAEDPAMAQRRSDALTSALLSELDHLRMDELKRRDFGARAAITQYQEDVSATRERITQLQQSSGLNSADQYAGLIENTENLSLRSAKLHAQFSLRKSAAETLRGILGLSPEAAALTLKLQSDPEFAALGKAMSSASARLAEARADLGEKHPALIAARDDYEGARAKFYARAGEVTGLPREELTKTVDLAATDERAILLSDFVRAVAERDGLAAERDVVDAELAAARARIRSLVATAAELDDLQRDYQVAEAVFASAIARNDTEKSDIFASYPLVQVLEPASLPIKPSSPHTIIALGAGVAATMCMIVALILGWLRKSLINSLARAVGAKPEETA